MKHQTDITRNESMMELQKAQIEEMRSQADREKARTALQEQERKGVMSHLLKNKNIIKEHTGHEVTGEEPMPVALKLLEASNKAMWKGEQDKLKLRQLQDVDTELRHIETTIKSYATFKPEITNPNQAAQNALIADKIRIGRKKEASLGRA